jgi:uncharacterized protein
LTQEVALGLIFFLGAFTMSFAGFGLSMVTVPLLTLFWPMKMAVAVQFPYVWGLFIYQAWRYKVHLSWQELRPLAGAATVGILVGTFLLCRLPEAILIRMLSAVIALAVLINFSPVGKKAAPRYTNNPWWGRICGFFSGAFLGAYTIGGPPAVLYIMSIVKDARKAKGLMAAYFSVQFLFLAVIYCIAGLFSWEGLKHSLMFAPAIVLGSIAGFWAFGKASNRTYSQTVNALLIGIALYLWIGV